MPVLGITGGIATGKSSFVRALRESRLLDPALFFDADETAHSLLAGDPAVMEAVTAYFGPSILDEHGRPERSRLRAVVFAEPAARRKLEEILHPAIRARWLRLAAEYRERKDWLFVDIPLLYETEAQGEFARVVVIACSPATQRRRLREDRKLDPGLIENIISAQLDLHVKVAQAQHVVWNDSTPACLARQAHLLAEHLRHLYV